ncbi:hypothetical protein M758_2G146300 [Ceratodon purpureus]|nr:hypothetical protein M758_2G146300 [Ceratodon purpureus]
MRNRLCDIVRIITNSCWWRTTVAAIREAIQVCYWRISGQVENWNRTLSALYKNYF